MSGLYQFSLYLEFGTSAHYMRHVDGSAHPLMSIMPIRQPLEFVLHNPP